MLTSAAERKRYSDMFGNIWEWCTRTYLYQPSLLQGAEYTSASAELRGGGFYDDLTKVEPFLDPSLLNDREETFIRI